jgi:hypothetical protein
VQSRKRPVPLRYWANSGFGIELLNPLADFIPNPELLDAVPGFTLGGAAPSGSVLAPDDARDDGEGGDEGGGGIDMGGIGGTMVLLAL